jgi:proline racemase
LVEFYEKTTPPRNVVIFGRGQVDRSPCGTGTSAKMALLHAMGELKIGEEYCYQSILGTEFIGRIVAETAVGERQGITPEVTGSAYVVGLNTLILTEGDPFPYGFALNPESQEEN